MKNNYVRTHETENEAEALAFAFRIDGQEQTGKWPPNYKTEKFLRDVGYPKEAKYATCMSA